MRFNGKAFKSIKKQAREEREAIERQEAEKVSWDTSKTANGLSGEELVGKVQRGYLTESQAMNTDY